MKLVSSLAPGPSRRPDLMKWMSSAMIWMGAVSCSTEPIPSRPLEPDRDLVEQLGNDDVGERDEAMARLKETADPSDPRLLRAVLDPDSEVALRAREIWREALSRSRVRPDLESIVTARCDRDRLREVLGELEGKRSRGESTLLEGNRRYQTAVAYCNRGEFEKAKIMASSALEAWPDHKNARALLNDLNLILETGLKFGARSIAEEAASGVGHHVQASDLEIRKHVRDGGRYFRARMYAEAVREFENAEYKIKNFPYESKEVCDLLPEVAGFLMKSRDELSLEKRKTDEEPEH